MLTRKNIKNQRSGYIRVRNKITAYYLPNQDRGQRIFIVTVVVN